MTVQDRNKGSNAFRAFPAKQRHKETPEVCEICGQELERDPESGEYFCPTCDLADHQP